MIDSTWKYIPAIILAQNGAVTGTPPEGDPAVITYDAQGFIDLISMQPVSEKVTNYTPTRRISKGARVLVAHAGDPCIITIMNGVRFLWVNEGIPFEEACP